MKKIVAITLLVSFIMQMPFAAAMDSRYQPADHSEGILTRFRKRSKSIQQPLIDETDEEEVGPIASSSSCMDSVGNHRSTPFELDGIKSKISNFVTLAKSSTPEILLWTGLITYYISNYQYIENDPAFVELITVLSAEVMVKKIAPLSDYKNKYAKILSNVLQVGLMYGSAFLLEDLDYEVIRPNFKFEIGLVDLATWGSFLTAFHGFSSLINWWSKNKQADTPYSYDAPSKKSLETGLSTLLKQSEEFDKSPDTLKALLEEMLAEKNENKSPKSSSSEEGVEEVTDVNLHRSNQASPVA